jgi:hypothetical protein
MNEWNPPVQVTTTAPVPHEPTHSKAGLDGEGRLQALERLIERAWHAESALRSNAACGAISTSVQSLTNHADLLAELRAALSVPAAPPPQEGILRQFVIEIGQLKAAADLISGQGPDTLEILWRGKSIAYETALKVLQRLTSVAPPPQDTENWPADEILSELATMLECEPDEILETVQRLQWAVLTVAPPPQEQPK